VDPPKLFKPSTNMNKNGNMIALRKTYEHAK